MIRLHRLNGVEVVVNAELIESMEAHPDTVLYLATGNRLVVTESLDAIIRAVVEYKKTVFVGATYVPAFLKPDPPSPAAGRG